MGGEGTPPSAAGRLLAIARRPKRGAPMEEVSSLDIVVGGGLDGDHKGRRFPRRGVTVLALEDWHAALDDLAHAAALDARPDIPWIARRANLLVSGIRLPRARGGIVKIGPVVLEVTYPTQPCDQMDKVRMGLKKALHPNWRGGITCVVLEGGTVSVGAPAAVLVDPPEKKIRLPG
jgi:MOSC domain-containing protein YiiM